MEIRAYPYHLIPLKIQFNFPLSTHKPSYISFLVLADNNIPAVVTWCEMGGGIAYVYLGVDGDTDDVNDELIQALFNL